MITLLTGLKGSGKTKRLIEMTTAAADQSQGNVVFIEKGQKLTYDIPHVVRLVDAEAYGVKGGEALCGFLAGICAGNYDVTDIFMDSTLKITGTGAEVLEVLVPELEKLCAASDANFCLSISASEDDIPEVAKKYILK